MRSLKDTIVSHRHCLADLGYTHRGNRTILPSRINLFISVVPLH